MSRCWIEIDEGALVSNVRVLRARLPKETAVMAVVKADAYGHGWASVMEGLRSEVEWFGVANAGEALRLEEWVGSDRVFVLSALLEEERAVLVEHGWRTWISGELEARQYAALAAEKGVRLPLHMKIDTGMGRLGVMPEEAERLLRFCGASPHLEIEGVATHLALADESTEATREQVECFAGMVERLRSMGWQGRWVHACNSAGSLVAPYGNLVRLGLALYGVAPVAGLVDLRPVMTWKTRITALREIPVGHPVSYGSTWRAARPTRMAVLAVGYADGYPRSVSNRGGRVMIRGGACPILGRVTMDQMMVDVTDLEEVYEGEEAVLLGRDGEAMLGAEELAVAAGTIPWEIFTNLSRPRVERRRALE